MTRRPASSHCFACGLFAVGVGLATLLTGCGSGDDEAEAAETRPRPVRAVEVQPQETTLRRELPGRTRAALESRLSFRVAGQVDRRPIEIGDRLDAGDLVAALDPADFRLRVEEARAGLEQAEAAARNAETSYRRTRALYADDNASAAELDAAVTARDQADGMLEAAEKRLALARRALDYATLRAPATGRVTDVFVEAGENVAAGAPVAAFARSGAEGDETSGLEIAFDVPAGLIHRLEPGLAVDVRLPALADLPPLAATITEVGAAPRTGATIFPAVARLDAQDAPDSRLRPGLAAEVALTLSGGDDAENAGSGAIVLPSAAVIGDPGGRFVFVVESAGDAAGDNADGASTVARRRDVEVGRLSSAGLEITAGLAPGETVVTAGATRLDDGDAVRLLETDPLRELGTGGTTR